MARGPPIVLEIYPCGPSKNAEEKLKWITYHTYSWKSQFGNDTRQSFFPVLTFYEIYLTHLPTSHFTLSNKRGIQSTVDVVFSCISGAAPLTQPGATRIHNRGPKTRTFSCIYDFLIAFSTPCLHTEMVTYCMSCTNNEPGQIAYTVSQRWPTHEAPRATWDVDHLERATLL